MCCTPKDIHRNQWFYEAKMCGIVGYVGRRNCLDILMEGLKRLEYRGYDSAGVALINGQGLKPMIFGGCGDCQLLYQSVQRDIGLETANTAP